MALQPYYRTSLSRFIADEIWSDSFITCPPSFAVNVLDDCPVIMYFRHKERIPANLTAEVTVKIFDFRNAYTQRQYVLQLHGYTGGTEEFFPVDVTNILTDAAVRQARIGAQHMFYNLSPSTTVAPVAEVRFKIYADARLIFKDIPLRPIYARTLPVTSPFGERGFNQLPPSFVPQIPLIPTFLFCALNYLRKENSSVATQNWRTGISVARMDMPDATRITTQPDFAFVQIQTCSFTSGVTVRSIDIWAEQRYVGSTTVGTRKKVATVQFYNPLTPDGCWRLGYNVYSPSGMLVYFLWQAIDTVLPYSPGAEGYGGRYPACSKSWYFEIESIETVQEEGEWESFNTYAHTLARLAAQGNLLGDYPYIKEDFRTRKNYKKLKRMTLLHRNADAQTRQYLSDIVTTPFAWILYEYQFIGAQEVEPMQGNPLLWPVVVETTNVQSNASPLPQDFRFQIIVEETKTIN